MSKENPIIERVAESPTPEPGPATRDISKIVAILALLGLLICLISHYRSGVVINWSRTKDFTDAVSHVIQSLAIITGGLWAYFKFRKSRTFQESLIPGVVGKFVTIDDRSYLIINTQVKNVGESRIDLLSASALIVFEYLLSPGEDIHTVAEKRITSFDVFEDKDQYIEPNEIIERTRFIAIPSPLRLGYRLEIEVISSSGFTWRSSTIVEKSSSGVNIASSVAATLEGG
jgi:hypothetical protein